MIIEWSRGKTTEDVSEVLELALEFTANAFWFGLKHQTRLSYDELPREGNCIEYSHLFARTAEYLGLLYGHEIEAKPLRSGARFLGKTIPIRGWKTHDWVMVRSLGEGQIYYVDAAFYDYWLGWDISVNLKGKGALY